MKGKKPWKVSKSSNKRDLGSRIFFLFDKEIINTTKYLYNTVKVIDANSFDRSNRCLTNSQWRNEQ